MPGQSYFQLITPMILLVFAGGFAAIGHYASDKKSVRMFALSYLLAATAFCVDYFRPLLQADLASFTANFFYATTVMTFCAAMFHYYRGRIPWLVLVTVVAAMMAGMAWSHLVEDSFALSTFVMNAGSCAMFLFAAISVRRETVRGIDRILRWLVIVNAVQLLARIVLVLWYQGASLTQDNYVNSIAAISLHFSISVAGLSIAAALFVLFGIEIVGKLKHSSETDPLTGVLNRRGFYDRLAELTALLETGAGGHAVVVADIDRFKSVNDRHGHDAGDRVIAKFAEILSDLSRNRDAVVRWGGEEFVIVIANGDVAMARLYAETARTVFQSTRHDCLDGATVTASFGIAAWTAGQEFAAATSLADEALYLAKRAGRNRLSIHGPETVERRAGRAGEAGAAGLAPRKISIL